jgi:L-malate glycosyltransferase
MAHALPVVAPAVGGIGEVVRNQREGLLIDGREPAAYAQACRRLLHDRALRRQMGKAGRQRVVAEFSTTRMAERYRQLYRELQHATEKLNSPLTTKNTKGTKVRI